MKALLPWLLLAVMATRAEADGLADCAKIDEREQRLNCYDALAHRPVDRVPSAALVTPRAPAARTPAAVISEDDPNAFGLTAVQRGVTYAGPAKISARIASISSSVSDTFVTLDSGQVWAVAANDGRLSAGDAITIKRASMGSYLIVAPSHNTYRAKRLK
jgi:hypothetical protein